VQRSKVLCGVVRCCVVLYRAVLYCAVHCSVELCGAVQCCAVLCCTVLCCAVPVDDAVVVQIAEPPQDLPSVVAHCPDFKGTEVLQQVSHRPSCRHGTG
jgi:hypothetical protein